MSWFKRHLHLTWLFGALLVPLVGSTLISIGLDSLGNGNNPGYFFIWFMLPINAWILNQKGRSLHWLWLAFFFVPYITLILGNKKQSLQKQKTLPPDNKKDKINKQKKEKRTKQKITPKPLFYILVIVFSVLIVLGILASIIILTTRDQVKIPQLGDKAPNFTLKSIEGESISLSDFRGKIVLLVFDHTNCPASIRQLPYIKAVYNQSNGDLIVLFVYVFNGLNLVNDYVVDNQITTFPALLDPKGKVANSYGSGHMVPVNFIIDTEGIIRIKKIGGFGSQEEIENILKSI